jgi:septal ring factor EnvC (AmiA/AmiB activator)
MAVFPFFFLVIMFFPGALLSDPVIKEEIHDYREHLDATKKELNDIKEQIKQQRESLLKDKSKEKATSRYIQKLDRELDMTRKELNVFKNNIGVLENGIKDITARIAVAEKEKDEKKQAIMQILRRQYEQKDAFYLRFLLKSGNIADFVRRYKFVKILSGKNAEEVENYRRMIEKLEDDKQSLVDYKSELTNVKTAKESEFKRYNGEKQQKNAILKDIKTNIKQRSRMLVELENNARKLTKFIDGLEATVELSDKGAERAFNDNRGRFPWPVDAGYILAGFGKYKHPQFKTIVENRGLHIKEKYGAPVYTIFGGIVKYADWFEGYGKTVIIYHGGGYFSIYGHLSDIDVANGQHVTIKQVIGKVGDTESFYGDELYFELRKKGTPVDPMRYLKKR